MPRPLIARVFGGSRQLSITDEADLAAIDALDPARWAATSVPVGDLRCDPAFVEAVDGHSKGRVRVSEVVAARDWIFARLADRRDLALRTDVLRLAALAQGPDGQRVRKAAEHVLAQLGAAERDRITLAQVRQFTAGYAATLANGDGVVCPGLLPEPEAAAYVKDVLAVVPGVPDASGQAGVDAATLAAFLDGAEGWLAWWARRDDPAVSPWGADTAAAVALVDELDAKLEEYFLHCALTAQHGAHAERLRLAEEELRALVAAAPDDLKARLARAALATPRPDGVLALDAPVNPAYRERLDALRERVLARALGGAPVTALTRDAWRGVRATFDAHRAWVGARPALPYDALGEARVRAMRADPALERVRHFMAVDAAAAGEVAAVKELEQVVLHQRWLVELANNVVNFSAIYDPAATALVERGTLVLDGRRLEFCIRVEDRAAHKKVATESLLFLVYATVSGRDKDGEPPFEVVAPVTSGERGRLRPGKRGIFIDTAGREWDAVVAEVVENPISLWEAVVAPFRRAAAFVGKKLEDLASSKLAAAEASAQAEVGKATPPAPPAPAPAAGAAAPAAGGAMQNMLLMGTVAVAAVSSALAYVVSAIASVSPLAILGVLLGIAALIAALSGFIGWLKLRRRDMSLLLEANGWAVNVPMKVTRRVGGLFTRRPPFPRGTARPLGEAAPMAELDEEAQDARRRRRRLVTLVVVLGLVGALGGWLAWDPAHRVTFRAGVERVRALFAGDEPAPMVEEPAPVTSDR
jgi:hypothetical protein